MVVRFSRWMDVDGPESGSGASANRGWARCKGRLSWVLGF